MKLLSGSIKLKQINFFLDLSGWVYGFNSDHRASKSLDWATDVNFLKDIVFIIAYDQDGDLIEGLLADLISNFGYFHYLCLHFRIRWYILRWSMDEYWEWFLLNILVLSVFLGQYSALWNLILFLLDIFARINILWLSLVSGNCIIISLFRSYNFIK